MSLDNPQLAQDLPLDVFKYMLETTALLDRTAARNLVLVSKTIQSWIDPILYRKIVLYASFHLFARCIRLRNNPEFFRMNVRSLCIISMQPPKEMEPQEMEDARLVLSTCTGVVSMALWVFRPPSLSPLFIAPLARPSSMSFFHLPPLDISHVLTSSVTVLELQLENDTFAYSDETWNTLFVSCPNLTTLLLNDEEDLSEADSRLITDALTSILSSPGSCLQSIILRPSDLELRYHILLAHFQAFDDARIVVVPTSEITHAALASMQRMYPGLVLFLPDVATSGGNENQILSDWGYAPPHVGKLWERVEEWRKGGR